MNRLIHLLVACILGAGCAGVPLQPTPSPAPSEGPPDRSALSYVDNLLAKVDAGEWSLGEGLVATLKEGLGDAQPTAVLRSEDLTRDDGTGILAMADDYLATGADEAAKAEIARLLDIFTFTEEELEAMAGVGGGPTAALSAVDSRTVAQATADCANFWHGAPPPGVAKCLEWLSNPYLDEFYGAGKYRVFFPARTVDQAGWTKDHYDLALAAMEDSVKLYKSLGKIGEVNIVFSAVYGPGYSMAARPQAGSPCPVIIFKKALKWQPAQFKQIVAHELGHCLEAETYVEQVKPDYTVTRWWIEGLADYLSNLVYRDPMCKEGRCDVEWEAVKEDLPPVELTTTLFERAYDNSIFFQYLDKRLTTAGALNVILELPPTGGRDEQAAGLAKVDGMADLYQEFSKALTDGTVEDSGEGTVPFVGLARPLTIGQAADPLLNEKVKPFGIRRYQLQSAEGRQVDLSLRLSGNLRESARPINGGAWMSLPSQLPDVACDAGRIWVVTTIDKDNSFELKVPAARELGGLQAGSGGGIVGEWVIDSASIRARVENTFAQQVVDHYGGEIRANFRPDGLVDVDYSGFSISGHSDVSGFGDAQLHTELTITTDAHGTTTYRVQNDYIFYGDTFEQDYLVGTETVHTIQKGELFNEGGYKVPVDIDNTESSTDGVGWELFSAAQRFDLQCGGSVLRFLSGSSGEVMAVLHRQP